MLLLIKKESTVEWIYLLVNFDFRGSQTFVSKTYAVVVSRTFSLFFQFILVYLICSKLKALIAGNQSRIFVQHLIFFLDFFLSSSKAWFWTSSVFIQSLIKWCIIISGGRLGTWMNYPSMNFHRSQVHFFWLAKKPGLLLAIIAFL